jgi:hypothetical protein
MDEPVAEIVPNTQPQLQGFESKALTPLLDSGCPPNQEARRNFTYAELISCEEFAARAFLLIKSSDPE